MIKPLPAYEAGLTSCRRYRIFYGGAGSGKSYTAAQDAIARAAGDRRERILVLRKVARTIRGSTFQLFRDILSTWRWEAVAHLTDMRIAFPSGGEIIHAGLDDVEKLKSIAGITRIWIEEATEITEDDFNQVDLRLRGVPADMVPQITITFNPISGHHWLKRRFFDEMGPDHPDVFILKTTYRDNPHAGEEYARVLQAIPDENYRRIYAEGEWGHAVKGLIYPAWEAVDAVPEAEHVYGLDFGFNNPTSLVRVARRESDLYIDELLYEKGLTNEDLIARMKVLVPDRDTPIYADAAEPQRIEEIYRAGFNVHPADKSVNDGIDNVKRHAIYVTTGSVNVQNELRSYKWAEDKHGTVLDKPVKFMDHALDATRYATHTHWQEADTFEVII